MSHQNRSYAITLRQSACANGELFEHRLLIDGSQVGPSVFHTIQPGEYLPAHAADAFVEILKKVVLP